MITVDVDPELQQRMPNCRGTRVTITQAEGMSNSWRVDAPRGHSSRGGATWEGLSEKWHDGLPECDVDRVISLGRGLDELEDVTVLAGAFQKIPITGDTG
jgi:2-methylcitrate dehydratase PrpD